MDWNEIASRGVFSTASPTSAGRAAYFVSFGLLGSLPSFTAVSVRTVISGKMSLGIRIRL